MAIVYFYAEDEKHYSNDGIKKIQDKYLKKDSATEIIKCFTEDSVEINFIDSFTNNKNIYIICPIYFHLLITKYSSFVKVVRLENERGILTSQDIKFGIKPEEKLKIKLNSSVTKPTVTFADYGGAKELIEETGIINNLFKLGLPVKGIFLAGIPGTGKSFFAKCLAGQLNRYLIELNLTKFMKSDNSIILIEEFFDFFKTNPGNYIIWLDEIEKMFVGSDDSTQLLGTLLTKINDFNSNASSLKSTAFIVATANNVYDLSSRNPEFFRNGRFDLLLSLNPPTSESAKNIFEIYMKSCRKNNLEILLNAAYLAITDNLDCQDNNGLLSNVRKYVESKKQAINTFISEHKISSKKEFTKTIISNNTYFTESTKKDLSLYEFTFDITAAVGKTFEEHRDKCQNAIKFPYVPAEIEFLVTSLYRHYLFTDVDLKQSIIEEYIRKIKPLQASMKDQIEKMSGVVSDFRQI